MNNGTNKSPGGFGKFMDRISWFDERLAEFAGWIVIVMMVTISYDVAMRYIFGMPTTWSFEINRYMLILVVFFGGAWALPAGGHVAVDIFTEYMETRKKAILEILTSIMALAYMSMFFMESTVFAWDAWEGGVRSTEYLAWPLWPMRTFLVIGSLCLSLEFLFRVVRNVAILTGTAQSKSQGGV
ncbi:MAG: TRAP transporter small permease subunit [Deltaproteobacteria bacterium]|nr:TRAP transporter small permease subunit [Deltaproteobacteria bacterium]